MTLRLLSISILLVVSIGVYAQTPVFELRMDAESMSQVLVGNKIHFLYETNSTDELLDVFHSWTNITSTKIDDNTLSITLTGTPTYLGVKKAKHLQNSFVVDFNENVVQQFVAEFKGDRSPPYNEKSLASYVNAYIDDTTSIHGFNFASTVAKTRSGDCTEYAVLTAALARSLGLPARVVLGAVIAEHSEKTFAYGHAWTEIWINGKWELVDSALFGSDFRQLFYLPTGALENEGPSYGLSLYQTLNRLPKQISQLKSLH